MHQPAPSKSDSVRRGQMGDLALGFEELGAAEPAPAMAVAEIEGCVDLARGEREQGASAAARLRGRGDTAAPRVGWKM